MNLKIVNCQLGVDFGVNNLERLKTRAIATLKAKTFSIIKINF